MQACRALMIIALLLGLGAMIIALLGLKCIKIGSASDESKGKIAATGGILSILAGESALGEITDQYAAIYFLTQHQ